MDISANGLHDRRIDDMPVSVLDFETTGMWAGTDRVVEVAVVRVEPGREPELVFDTLINPCRRVAATFVHGITDNDVADAPRFEQIADRLRSVLAGCVLAAYNVSFDVRFLEYEMGRVGHACPIPYVCLMYLRQMLGLGMRCRLAAACQAHGIPHELAHSAAGDALASARLWTVYARAMAGLGLRTFGELAAFRRYKFAQSFIREMLPKPPPCGNEVSVPLKSRLAHSMRDEMQPVPSDW
jgi:DNA polymerase-3 subunit epsilon